MTTRLLVVAAAALGAACLVDVQEVSDPGPAFADARREVARLEGRSGPPESLQVLAYDRKKGHLVRASVSLGRIEGVEDAEIDLDLDEETVERVHRKLRLSELRDAPLGPIVEVEEEDGDRVLVWLK